MRSAIAVVSAVAMVMAQMSSGFAQNAALPPAKPVALDRVMQDATVHSAIVDAFKAFPNGGDLLSKRIADIIVKDPKLAVGLVKHMQTARDLTKEQRLAAERGVAAALNRLGIKAADLPVAAPAAYTDYTWILGLLAVAGIICLGICRKDKDEITPF